ncbi:hypothetical protein BC2230_120082 [Burkholderia cepacia]|uniref:hypothetical protein n=1 Tax=Burkholderia cepacia TaxID=292 RepID=UPI0039A4FD53
MTTDTQRGASRKAAGTPGKRTSGRAEPVREVKAAGGKRTIVWPNRTNRALHAAFLKQFGKKSQGEVKKGRLSDRIKGIVDSVTEASRARDELEQRVRDIEQRLYFQDRFATTLPRPPKARSLQDLWLVALEGDDGADSVLLIANSEHDQSRLGDVAPTLVGPLDRSKVTMKPRPRSDEEFRSSTLKLLGIDPDKQKSK